ncbi:tripartite tricarboxylate transporter substrate binding protein [Xenophilus arseniciresistens]|uniref:Tripartite tricarboxylate transporter substrate binding protein n=1 Tax=Xenophilus arseniciresistens TaxID=1283306 RepID=A0AAE3SZC1_9BURK|nr:tripartite tricarboxylate transporter substrate binding protein [Xenophilus arseniciresistens]MDA7416390.1 tripartite tricarboxylate transporter substrate binding protein [Xenophilus arseniciresistens]
MNPSTRNASTTLATADTQPSAQPASPSSMKRRTFAGWMAASACLGASPSMAAAYPARAVRVVVAWPGGGLVDIPARLAAEHLQKTMGQPFVIDNKAGAGGNLGADLVAKAPPDGHTLLVTTSAIAINHAVGMRMPFDLFKDFEPVASLARAPLILVTHTDSGIQSVEGLIRTARVRQRQGQLSYASAGNGSPGHLAGEWFKAAAKVEAVHVPYKGAPPAMVDQVAGRVDYHFANAAVALPQIQAGKLRALAVATGKRLALLPEVPTMIESGLQNFDADQWIGMLAPRATPRAVVEALAAEIRRGLAGGAVEANFARSGLTVATTQDPKRFAQEIRADALRWERVVQHAGIKVE